MRGSRMTEFEGHVADRAALCKGTRAVRAFTLIDVLVSMAVIALLIGIMMPSLSLVKETARRVACASNVRQIGLGFAMYGDDHKEHLPPTVFLRTPGSPQWDMMVMLRVGLDVQAQSQTPAGDWDGLGVLYVNDYLNAARLFYCPSHTGEHTYDRYASMFGSPLGTQSVVCNYQYRGTGPNNQSKLWRIIPSHSALVTDSLRSVEDFNHRKGTNVLRADLTMYWFSDSEGNLSSNLINAAVGPSEAGADAVRNAWEMLDANGETPDTGSHP